MPLDLAAALRRRLLDQFPADRAYGRAALRAEAMPPLVAALLDWTLDRWTALERERLHSPWFDFDAAEVQEAEAVLFEALERTARVPAEAWADTLGGAIDLVVRFLTTPARALTDALFEGSAEPLPADAVRMRLGGFAAYPYLTQAVLAHLRTPGTGPLDPPALFDLLDRADRRAVQDHGPDEWLRLLRPLFRLAEHANLHGVPAALLRGFFQAKGDVALAERLHERGDVALNEAALREMLRTVEEKPPMSNEGEEEDEDSGERDLARREEPARRGEPARREEDVPLWEQFARDGRGDGSINALFGSRPPNVNPPVRLPAEEEAPLWQQLSVPPPAPAAPPPSAPPLRRPEPEPLGAEPDSAASLGTLEAHVFGRAAPGRRDRFVEHLFRGDASAYATVLQALGDAETWTEASQIIARDVFRPFRVDIYGADAVAFTDAVEARFRG